MEIANYNSEAAKDVLEVLIDAGLAPKNTKPKKLKHEWDVLYLLRCNIGEASIEIWPEDFGTERDAGKDYVSVTRNFASISQGDFAFKNLSSKTDGDLVSMTFKDRGKEYKWEFEQYSDHFSEDFVRLIIDFSKEVGEGQFIDINGEDMAEFAYVTNSVADILYKYGIISND